MNVKLKVVMPLVTLVGVAILKGYQFCCVNTTDMDACNFLLEESECARRVVRNSHDN